MLHDILASLLGFTGDIIIDTGKTFKVINSFILLSESEKDQINKITPLGWFYNELSKYSNKHNTNWRLNSSQLINESYKGALAAGITDFLEYYSKDILFLEQYILTNESVPISYFLQYLQKYIITMPIVYKLCMDIERKGIRGCYLLDYISNLQSGVEVVNDVIKRLVMFLRIVFMKQTASWTLFGDLDDPALEYFIQLKSTLLNKQKNEIFNNDLDNTYNILLSSNNLSLKDSSFDWTSSYIIKLEYLPDSLVNHVLASKILFCGKAVKLLNSIDSENISISNSLEYIDIYEYLSGRLYNADSLKANDSDLSNKLNDNESVDTINKPMYDQLVRNGYQRDKIDSYINQYSNLLSNNGNNSNDIFEQLIYQLHDNISNTLWQIIKHKYNFMKFLQSIRNLYLLGKGEFYQNILDNIIYLLDKPETIDDKIDSINYNHDTINDNQFQNIVINNSIKLLGYDIKSMDLIVKFHINRSKFILEDGCHMTLLGSAIYENITLDIVRNDQVDSKMYISIKSNNNKSINQRKSSRRVLILIPTKSILVDDTIALRDHYERLHIIDSNNKQDNKINYLYGGLAINDLKYVFKGFHSSIILSFDWNAIKSNLSPYSSLFNESTPSICLGGISMVLHNDRHGKTILGSGSLGLDGLTSSVIFGISINARTKPSVSNEESESKELDGRQIEYFATLFVTVNSSIDYLTNRLSINRISNNSITKDNQSSSNILSSKDIIISFESSTKSLTGRIDGNSSWTLDIDYIRDILTTTNSTITSVTSTNSLRSLYSNIMYNLKLKLTSTSNSSPIILDTPLDISKYVKLSNGQSNIILIGSSISYTNKNNVTNQLICSNIGINVIKYDFIGLESLSSYPIVSSFTSVRYPETFLRFELEMKKLKDLLNISIQYNYPKIFHVIMDHDAVKGYERLFSFILKIRVVGHLLEKLWMIKSRLSSDRLFCQLRHSMHFFISNLLYYLQVDVIDSEFSILVNEVNQTDEFQYVLKLHRNFIANIMRLSFIDNTTVQDSIEKVVHICLRFICASKLLYRSENDNSVILSNNSYIDTSSVDTDVLVKKHWKDMPIIIPTEEFDSIRKEFYTQISYLFQIISKVENRGFMFRLDFNGYLSSIISNHVTSK